MAETTFYMKETVSPEAIQSIESILTELNGVERALVDTDDGEVKIQFDERIVSKQRLVITLQEHGFQLRPH